MKKINNITIIGSGNVATQLGLMFFENGIKIDGILSSNEESGKLLVNKTSSRLISKSDDLPKNSDLYLAALKDDLYLDFLKDFDLKDKFIVHTSGSLDTELLNSISKRWGCLYPLQSINKFQEINWVKVSFFIETALKEDEVKLIDLCEKLHLKFDKANSTQRKKLHIAAVATSNFTYHLLSTIRHYCEENKLNFKDLQNLLTQSINNSYEQHPFSLQTGPARRKDLKLISEHLKLIENNNLKEIYELFTQQIINQHHEL